MELDYKSQLGQSIFDVSNITLYGMDNIVMGLLSPSSKSLNSILATDSLVYNNDYVQNSTIQLQLDVPASKPNYVIKGLDGQSTFDLCLMKYGNLDVLVSLIQENSDLVSINDIDVSLKEINFSTNKSDQNYTVSTIAKKGYVFGTIDKTNMPYFRILEDSDFRITEDGNYRILE